MTTYCKIQIEFETHPEFVTDITKLVTDILLDHSVFNGKIEWSDVQLKELD